MANDQDVVAVYLSLVEIAELNPVELTVPVFVVLPHQCLRLPAAQPHVHQVLQRRRFTLALDLFSEPEEFVSRKPLQRLVHQFALRSDSVAPEQQPEPDGPRNTREPEPRPEQHDRIPPLFIPRKRLGEHMHVVWAAEVGCGGSERAERTLAALGAIHRRVAREGARRTRQTLGGVRSAGFRLVRPERTWEAVFHPHRPACRLERARRTRDAPILEPVGSGRADAVQTP
eukprot:378445-Rhodomonas_salina.1